MSIDPSSIPPWLQEQLAKMQQMQGSLQGILAQKQQVEAEKVETAKALEEVEKSSDEETIFKYAGSILVRTTRAKIKEDLEERRELASTRSTVLEKQEARLRENLKEHEAKVSEMLKSASKGGAAAQPGQPPRPDGAQA